MNCHFFISIPSLLFLCALKLQQDLEVLLVALPHDYTYLSHVPPAALRDYAFLKRALTLNGLCLELVPHPANRQVIVLKGASALRVWAYIVACVNASFLHIIQTQTSNHLFIFGSNFLSLARSLLLCSFVFLFLPSILSFSFYQPDLLLAAVQSKGAAYAHVPVDLRGDPQLVLAAVASNPAHLLLAPHALRGHRAFLSHLLTVCPLALAYTWPSVSVRSRSEL